MDAICGSVMRTGRLVTVEDGWHMYGVGAEICAALVESAAFDYLDGNNHNCDYETNLKLYNYSCNNYL